MVQFDVVQIIGEGAFGKVTKNKTPRCKSYYTDHKVVAIKRIKDMNDENARNEVRILSKLKHKNVVQYLDHFQEANKKDLCIVMEYCNYGTLTKYIQGNKIYSEAQNILRGTKYIQGHKIYSGA